MRLDKILEKAQLGSRKAVKRLLLTGEVQVNHLTIRQGSFNADPVLDVVTVKGEQIIQPAHTYLMLYKPAGVVTAVRDHNHQTVLDLVDTHPAKEHLFPVGRLDRDTEGLLLLTDNGKLAYQLLGPANHVIKGYEVVVNGLVTAADVQAFQEGIVFHGGTTCQPASLKIISASDDESHVYLEIAEGKFHQVKKMFLVVGKKVTYLKRVKMGSLTLTEELKPGGFRDLSETELSKLKKYFNPAIIKLEKNE